MEIITQDGWLEVITGCMFSGKTEELVRRLRRAVIAKKETIAIKPALDTRYDLVAVVSHSGFSFNAIPVEDPKSILGMAKDAEVVGIDEAQFFTGELVPVIRELLQNKKRVIKLGKGTFSCSVSSGTGRGSKTLVDGRFSFLIHCPCLHHLLAFLCFSCLLTTMPS